MLDIKLVRANPELVKENIKKKFQDEKLVLVDEVLELDKQFRDAKSRGDYLRSQRNTLSKQIGGLMAKGQKEQAEEVKAQVTAMAQELADLEVKEEQLTEEIKKRMMVIPNIIDESVDVYKRQAKWSREQAVGAPAARSPARTDPASPACPNPTGWGCSRCDGCSR